MAATIRDVAHRAGVSPSTVSRVLNNKGVISDETAQRIQKAMQELHYVPNDFARSFATGSAPKHIRTISSMIPFLESRPPPIKTIIICSSQMAQRHLGGLIP